MNFTRYFEVIQQLPESASLSQLRLVDGDLLQGCHVPLHTPAEAALYGFSDLSASLPDLTRILAHRRLTQALTAFESRAGSWNVFHFEARDAQSALQGLSQCYLYFPLEQASASLIAFQELVAHLRAPEGCPWDREQTHQSLKTNLLEETYEVLDAIDSKDAHELQEELGDLLLQILLHAQIASETGSFDLGDVIQSIHHKITFRHPHVFKDLNVNGVKDVVHNWEKLKSQEREHNNTVRESILASIPRGLPSLSLAQKYQERAARVGFDWPEIEPVLDKVIEEVNELRQASDGEAREAELGDLFFALVNVARWVGLDAESALRKMTARFYERFMTIEQAAASEGRRLSDLSLEEMDALWEAAKKQEH